MSGEIIDLSCCCWVALVGVMVRLLGTRFDAGIGYMAIQGSAGDCTVRRLVCSWEVMSSSGCVSSDYGYDFGYGHGSALARCLILDTVWEDTPGIFYHSDGSDVHFWDLHSYF